MAELFFRGTRAVPVQSTIPRTLWEGTRVVVASQRISRSLSAFRRPPPSATPAAEVGEVGAGGGN